MCNCTMVEYVELVKYQYLTYLTGLTPFVLVVNCFFLILKTGVCKSP